MSIDSVARAPVLSDCVVFVERVFAKDIAAIDIARLRVWVRHEPRKLDVEKVREIRKRIAAGESRRSVAKAFGVSKPAIQSIIKGETWSWC